MEVWIGVLLAAVAVACGSRLAAPLVRRFRHRPYLQDPLTGLPSRLLFVDRLEQALAVARRHKAAVAVLIIDLEGIGAVTDSLGYEGSDTLLRGVADRFEATVRDEDTLARFGGPEFAVLLSGVSGPVTPARVARRLFDQLRPPFAVGSEPAVVQASIGAAVAVSGELSGAELLRQATVAAHRARALGPGHFEMFEERMGAEATERLALEAAVRGAVDREEFVVEYQPEVRLDTGEVVAVEALVGWTHPDRGRLSPGEFASVAEDTGVITDLGRVVLDQAADDVAVLSSCIGRPMGLTLSLSLRQLRPGEEFVGTVRRALRRTGLRPSQLRFEIKESVFVESSPEQLAELASLRELGVELSVSQFGDGYWSLAHLRDLPVTTVRLAPSFMERLDDPTTRAIAEGIVDLCSRIGIGATVVGVDREEQVPHLRAIGCRLAQGPAFGPPMPLEVLASFVEESDVAGPDGRTGLNGVGTLRGRETRVGSHLPGGIA